MKKFIWLAVLSVLSLNAADIYVTGGLTVCDHNARRAPMTGWGTVLKELVKPGVKVHNLAYTGRSSKSFITFKNWENLLKRAKKGDFVIIQFGHADGVLGDKNFYRFTDAETTHPLYLQLYVEEAKLRGLHPVLLTQTVYCGFNSDGDVCNYKEGAEVGGAPYVAACKKLAAELGCDFIDINGLAIEKMSEMSVDEIKKLHLVLAPGESPNYPKGCKLMLPLSVRGAEFYASLFAEQAKMQNLKIAELLK